MGRPRKTRGKVSSRNRRDEKAERDEHGGQWNLGLATLLARTRAIDTIDRAD